MDVERFVPFRRRKLPKSITGTATAYAVDVALDPALLPNRRMSDETLAVPCMAERGDKGSILQMPYWVFLHV